jgi:hypothetical protein
MGRSDTKVVEAGLIYSKITNHSLLFGYCPNKHLHIFGFIRQIDDIDIDLKKMKATISAPCREFNCGCLVTQSYSIEWEKDLVCDGAGI